LIGTVQSESAYVIAVAEVAATIDAPHEEFEGFELQLHKSGCNVCFAHIAAYVHCSMACSFLFRGGVFCSIASGCSESDKMPAK
jgi:hypothetical protein